MSGFRKGDRVRLTDSGKRVRQRNPDCRGKIVADQRGECAKVLWDDLKSALYFHERFLERDNAAPATAPAPVPGKITWHRYVPFADIPAYMAMGWEWNPNKAPIHAPHGIYSVIMDFRGEGEPVEPAREEMIGGEV